MKTLIVLGFCFAVSARAQTAVEIIKKSDEARLPSGDISVTVVVKDYKKRVLEKETTYKVWCKGSMMSLVDTVAPQRHKGRKLLMIDHDLWFFTPDIKRPARISFQQKLTGEVSNGDLSRTNFSGDYVATIVKTETLKGKKAWVLDLKAARAGVTYNAIKYWVEQGTFMPIKADFYTVSGKFLKRAVYSKPVSFLGAPRITSVLIQDAVNSANESIVHYKDYKREVLPESFFNKDNIAQ